MDDIRLDSTPAKWQACVSTVQCDMISEHVSIMVKNDWTSYCTWYRQFKDQSPGSRHKMKPDKKTRKKLELCMGPLCSNVISYRDKLINESQETISKQETK